MSELKELLEKVKLENIMAFMIYGADSRRDAFENYEKEIEKSTGKPLPPVEVTNPKPVKKLPFTALFKGKLLRRTIVGSLVLIGMNTIQYTLMNWMPSMLSGLGYDTSKSQFMTMFGLFGAPFGIFIASLIMDKIPRRVMGVMQAWQVLVLQQVFLLRHSE